MKKKFETGMTLIEVVVFITVMSILIGAMGLRMNREQSDVYGASALIQTHLLRVKELAMGTRQLVGLSFDLAETRYEGVAIGTEPDHQNPFLADPLQIDLNVMQLSTDLDSDTILFNHFGVPVRTNGAPYEVKRTITITSGEDQVQIVVEPLTGYIHD